MANDASAVLFGEANLFVTPYDAENDFPVDTVGDGDFGKDWGKAAGQEGEWLGLGYTQDGINFNMAVERGEIVSDQVLDALFRPITGRTITLGSNLIEFTPGNLKLGLGQGVVTTVAAGEGTRGYDQYAVTGSVVDDYNTWGIDAQQPADGEPFRLVAWKGLATGGLQSNLGQRATAAQIPVEVTVLPDDSVTPARILTMRKYTPALAG